MANIVPLTVKKDVKDGLNYVWIPPGTFQMGCPEGENECGWNERPAHIVSITNGFWIGQTEVPQVAYQKIIGTNPSSFRGLRLPVERVTWNEATAYCKAINSRLPTEAEWEYAARAGTNASRYGKLEDIAWYEGNSNKEVQQVGQKLPNQWKLYDMLGNVWEWVQDWYDVEYYKESPTKDPKGPKSGSFRVVRGGGVFYAAIDSRVSERYRFDPNVRNLVGFRCIREETP
jgi:formylglycine-generating enzyme required for sulfatase activity